MFIKDAGILSRTLLAVAVMLTPSVPSYSQQDVDPTWYNPWPEPNKTVAQHAQARRGASGDTKKNITATANTRKKNSASRGARVQQRPKQVATTKLPSTR